MEYSKRFAFVFALAGINLVFAAKGLSLATPEPVTASGQPAVVITDSRIVNGAILADAELPQTDVKKAKPQQAKDSMRVTVTAYTNDPAETQDEYPGMTASGTYTRPGVAASNDLPFGTKFKVPKLFGDRIFTIEDRMNTRFNGTNYVDVWFASKTQAIQFGKRAAVLEIL